MPSVFIFKYIYAIIFIRTGCDCKKNPLLFVS